MLLPFLISAVLPLIYAGPVLIQQDACYHQLPTSTTTTSTTTTVTPTTTSATAFTPTPGPPNPTASPYGPCVGDVAYCVGGSDNSNIILRCGEGTPGILQPGNCNDNLDEPPLGAFCLESSPTAGDAICWAVGSPAPVFPSVSGSLLPLTSTTSVAPTTTSTSTTSTAVSSTTSTAAATQTPFTIIAAHDGTAIQLQPLVAYNGGIYIGYDTSSYCPDPPVTDCPNGITTAFVANPAYGTAAMDVEVPGGQLLYVETSGALGFTQAHSAYIPPGAVTTGFILDDSIDPGTFQFTGLGSQGWLACPVASAGSEGPWQVYAYVAGFGGDLGECIGFDARTAPFEGVGAWEYT